MKTTVRVALAVRSRPPRTAFVLPGGAGLGAVQAGMLDALVALDVVAGEEVRLSRGSAVEAVLAASAIPSVLPPVRLGDRLLAGADAVVSKRDTRRALLDAIRATSGGAAPAPEVAAVLRGHAAARLDPTDRAIVAMRLARTPMVDIAATVGLPARAMTERLAAIIARLLSPADEAALRPASSGDVPTLGNGAHRRQAARERRAASGAAGARRRGDPRLTNAPPFPITYGPRGPGAHREQP